MATVPFNTLAYAKKLEESDIPSKQAEAHAEALAKVLEENVLIKKDADLKFNGIEDSINSLRSEIKIEVANVKTEIIRWVFVIAFAQAAFILSALTLVLKFFH